MNILYFSYLSADKGVWVAFDVARKILSQTENTIFTFAGPAENEEITYTVKGMKMYYKKRFEYWGYIKTERARQSLMRSADIFIFPTLRESFGLVLLEAMAEGLSIVASREGCIPEILTNGLLFTKGDVNEMASQVMSLVSDNGLRKRIGALNRKRYEENYTIEKYGAKMISVFNHLESLDEYLG